jgi:hypothetical protein
MMLRNRLPVGLLSGWLCVGGLLGATVASGIGPQAALAGTCSTRCSVKTPIQFKPGQRIKVQVINRTNSLIKIENALGGQPLELLSGQTIEFYRGGSTDPNFSVVFWEATETPLRSRLSKPTTDTLKIDLSFAAQKPGDRSVYIRNDGRIDIL